MTQSQFWQDLKSGRFVSMVKESAKGQRLSNSQEVYNVLKPMLAKKMMLKRFISFFWMPRTKYWRLKRYFPAASRLHPSILVKLSSA